MTDKTEPNTGEHRKKLKQKSPHEVTKGEATMLNKKVHCHSEATPETTEKAKQQETEAMKTFQDPDLLLNIKEELDKDHVGDDKAKLFLFACACSTQLRPEYRFSTAISAETSEGKDNLWKTVYQHLPEGWFIDLTRITTASIEDDIKEYNGLYFGEGNYEGGNNAPIKDTIKQLVEDGIRVLKKDKKKECKESKYEEQPRKVGIYSTTANPNDAELASRYCVTSVHGSPAKYRLVNENTKRIASNVDLIIAKIERNDICSWIVLGLRRLADLKRVDIIPIPWAQRLDVESREGRSQRDFKRFLNLIRALAWICQENRIIFSYRGYKVLIPSGEDFYNALEIGKEIFDQSLSGLEPRLQKIIDAYLKISKETTNQTKLDFIENEEDKDLVWIDRSLIQKELEIKKRETIGRHFMPLFEMGLFVYFTKTNRTYVAAKFDSPSDLPSHYPLITVPQLATYESIRDNEHDILMKSLDGNWTVPETVFQQEKDKKRTSLLSLSLTDRPIPPKDTEKDEKDSALLSKNVKSDGKNRTVDKPALNEKLIDAKKIIKDFPEDNYTIIEEKYGSEFINKNIEQGLFFEVLLRRKLTFLGG